MVVSDGNCTLSDVQLSLVSSFKYEEAKLSDSLYEDTFQKVEVASDVKVPFLSLLIQSTLVGTSSSHIGISC